VSPAGLEPAESSTN